jgi:hypothetical protein
MKETSGWRKAAAAIERPFLWMAAWCRTVRTTYEVVRLLDREQQILATAPVGARPPFVARTGYVI